MYKRIIGLMDAYKPTDFHSPVLIQYVLHGLCFNKSLYAEVMKKDMSGELKQLIVKHIRPELQLSLLDLL